MKTKSVRMNEYSSFRRYVWSLPWFPPLSPAQKTELAARAHAGDERAQKEMIERNLRLVIRIAESYMYLGLSILDLISEGNIGLVKAVRRYDPNKGRFSGYAADYIKQHIKRALSNQSRTIRMPVHMIDKLHRLEAVSHNLYGLLNREPTDEELASELGVPVETIRMWKTVSLHRVIFQDPIIPFDDGSLAYEEVIPDPAAVQPDQELLRCDDLFNMRRIFPTLDKRMKTVLSMHFGLNGYDREYTLEEIGAKFNLSHEGIRQIEKKAFKILCRQMSC